MKMLRWLCRVQSTICTHNTIVAGEMLIALVECRLEKHFNLNKKKFLMENKFMRIHVVLKYLKIVQATLHAIFQQKISLSLMIQKQA